MWPTSITTHSRPRPSSLLSPASLTALLLFLPSCITAFDCGDILAQGVHFDLKTLKGPRKVHWLDKEYEHEERLSNYTFTIDICQALRWDKGTGKETNCEHGTQVCGIREDIDKTGSHGNTIVPISIAGNYGRGREIDERFELFKNSNSNADSDREGFRAELHGGKFGEHKQRAIIEFVCDRNRTGLEGEEKDKGEKDGDQKDDGDKDKGKDKDKNEGKDGGKDGRSKQLWSRDADDGCEDSDNSLRFCKYERGNDMQTLRLQWRTMKACEDNVDPGSDSKGWGFFTWFIIIVFLATAAYLIFGSWLNYNRYGARGWDLLPHGDTIRDVPYILKDWGRRVTSTLQGGGSRGGYSAV